MARSLNWRHWLTPGMVLFSLGALTVLQRASLEELQQKSEQVLTKAQYQQEAAQAKANLDLLNQLPALGFDNLIAGWAFLQFLQYFGDQQARSITGYSLSPKFFSIIIDRDPRFLQTYLFLSTSVSLYAGQPQKTIALIGQGLESLTPEMPDAFYVWVYKATDQLLFLGDAKGAIRSNAMAIKWAEIQNTPDSLRIANISRSTITFLSSNPISRRARVNAWAMILSNAVDDHTRQLVVRQIQKLGGTIKPTPEGSYRIIPPEQD